MFAPVNDSSVPFRAGLAALQASRFTASLDELAAARADLEAARARAEQASQRADQRKTDTAPTQLEQLQAAARPPAGARRPHRGPARRPPPRGRRPSSRSTPTLPPRSARSRPSWPPGSRPPARLRSRPPPATASRSAPPPGARPGPRRQPERHDRRHLGRRHHGERPDRRPDRRPAPRCGGGGHQPRWWRLPQQPSPDRRPPVQLRVLASLYSFQPVPAASRPSGPVDARAGFGHRLHVQRRGHPVPLERLLSVARGHRRSLRPARQLPRCVALVDERPLTRRSRPWPRLACRPRTSTGAPPAPDFLTDEWFDAVKAIRDKYADQAPPVPYKIRLNQVITGGAVRRGRASHPCRHGGRHDHLRARRTGQPGLHPHRSLRHPPRRSWLTRIRRRRCRGSWPARSRCRAT